MQKEIGWLLNDKYGGVKTPAFRKDVERLNADEPLGYVIGFTEFLDCRIDLSKKPLIPRPETEFWVEKSIKEICHDFESFDKRSISVLDIFAGSGCIGISIVRQIKNANIIFAEKDKKFLGQIKINCRLNDIGKKRYIVVQSDVFSNVNPVRNSPPQGPSGAFIPLEAKPLTGQSAGAISNGVKGKFDYIFANPPYIPTTRKNKIQRSVLKYEPRETLFGGVDGLLYIRKFLAKAKNFLNPDGKIFMEFDSTQKRQIEQLLKKYGYKNWQFHKDQYGKWRYVVIQ